MNPRVYQLSGFAVPEGLEALHELLARAAEENPAVPPNDVMLFETAVIEIANNVVEHGVPEGGVRWTFLLEVSPGRLAAVLTDSGAEFRGALDASLPDDPLSDSGRGFALAQATLDELTYTRSEDANHWRMVRRLGGP